MGMVIFPSIMQDLKGQYQISRIGGGWSNNSFYGGEGAGSAALGDSIEG